MKVRKTLSISPESVAKGKKLAIETGRSLSAVIEAQLLATPSDAGLEGEYWPGPALRPISRPEDARTAFLKRKHAPLVRHKKPGSRIVPKGRKSPQSVREAVAGLRRLQKQIAAREKGKPEMTWQEFKSSVEEGRP